MYEILNKTSDITRVCICCRVITFSLPQISHISHY